MAKPRSRRPARKAAATRSRRGPKAAPRSKPRSAAAPSKAALATIAVWEDDPISTAGRAPIQRPAPSLTGPLSVTISEAQPVPAVYAPATPEFRYWTAAEALRRGLDFWASHLPPGTNFQTSNNTILPVRLDDPTEDLNAYYVRARGLEFKHMAFPDRTIYTGESPDIVLHELGHAILDAIRPELFDAASNEIAAFHESFGDISAILVGARLTGLADESLRETGGILNRSSRLSRLMESLGWGVRQFRPDRAGPDCLRNAVNSWFYQVPDTLAPDGPDSALTSAPHSFSRVFTGGFFEALSGMLSVQSGAPTGTSTDLAIVADDAARLLVSAVSQAPVRPDYMSQVAAHLVAADASITAGKYREAIRGAMVRRGLLSLEAAAALTDRVATPAAPARRRGAAGAAPRGLGAAPQTPPPRSRIAGERLGMAGVGIFVSAPAQARILAATSAVGVGRPAEVSFDESSRSFVENLMRRGRIQVDDMKEAKRRMSNPWARKTHALRPVNGDAELVRLAFDCHGLD